VNRVNAAELKAVGSHAGSLKDQIEGWVKGKTEGQPIPPAILNATRELADLQEKAARHNYENKVLITNSTYGSKVKPIDLPGTSSGHNVGDTVRVGNKNVKITAIHHDGTFDGDEVK
jgi:hypothetical protein